MIGYYDYTVVLTYLSLLSGSMGIIVCLSGIGHPFIGIFFLMFSGLCDTFDGKVARMKKNRTREEMNYGIQIDSLADMVAFGVLPPCVGVAMLRVSSVFTYIPRMRPTEMGDKRVLYPIFLICICLFYVLTALIRLAYFNVMEEERSQKEEGARTAYVGLPVTSSALIFPTVMLVQYLTRGDLTLLYFGVMLITASLFISKIQVPKPHQKSLYLLLGIGALEFLWLLLIKYHFWKA